MKKIDDDCYKYLVDKHYKHCIKARNIMKSVVKKQKRNPSYKISKNKTKKYTAQLSKCFSKMDNKKTKTIKKYKCKSNDYKEYKKIKF
jgi:predicted double-glycine peptidase